MWCSGDPLVSRYIQWAVGESHRMKCVAMLCSPPMPPLRQFTLLVSWWVSPCNHRLSALTSSCGGKRQLKTYLCLFKTEIVKVIITMLTSLHVLRDSHIGQFFRMCIKLNIPHNYLNLHDNLRVFFFHILILEDKYSLCPVYWWGLLTSWKCMAGLGIAQLLWCLPFQHKDLRWVYRAFTGGKRKNRQNKQRKKQRHEGSIQLWLLGFVVLVPGRHR